MATMSADSTRPDASQAQRLARRILGEGRPEDSGAARLGREAPLAAKLAERTARIAILGQGYVGLPLAGRLASAGFRVLGIEPDDERCRAIRAREPVLGTNSAELTASLAEPLASGRYRVTSDPTELFDCDVAIVCVPTPLGPDRKPDLGAVRAAGLALGEYLAAGSLCVLESTTYPGTTRGAFFDALEDGRRAAERPAPDDLFVAYSPEREDPGRAAAEIAAAPKLVGGLDPASEGLATALYQSAFAHVFPTAGCEVAEAAKLFENVFRAVNIALVNEAKTVLEAMGIDVWRVLDAAATKPFGFMPFQPGPGMGGHCIPIDPFYFAWAGEQHGVRARFVELAGEVNREMPAYVTERLAEALAAHDKDLRGARILVLGLAYKADVSDVRESPALDLVDRLLLRGAHVEAADPHVASATTAGGAQLTPVPLTAERLSAADAVLVVTDHTAFDYRAIADHARLIVDTRGVMRAFAGELGERLVRA